MNMSLEAVSSDAFGFIAVIAGVVLLVVWLLSNPDDTTKY